MAWRPWTVEERWLVFAGSLGVAVAAFYACGDDDSRAATDETPDAGTGANASCERSDDADRHTADVVEAANAFLTALTAEQRTAASYERTLTNAQKWSNFPTTFVQRNGVALGELSEAAQGAAIALAEVAAGETGAKLLDELREADEFLVTDGKAASSDYGRGLYFFSIHGTPSTDAAWLLQIGGHHHAYNFTYAGKCTSATPLFDGVEPTTWTDGDGEEHAPLEVQRASMVALLAAVSDNADAKLSGTFSDLVNGPTGGPGGGSGGDTNYPDSLDYPTGTTGRGVKVGTLTAANQALVKTAIEAWAKNVAEPVSRALLDVYESDAALADTYVGYSGSADLTTQASYVRIDGPRVWIEVTVQGGIVYRDHVHFHTIWRDKAADYGAEYASQ
ncbi:MAG: DUF3500 domain-containing protein [Polyangiales bacterium]